MLSAVNENNEFVLATESEKTDGNFYCKGCGSQVLLKKGNIMMHHFSHMKNSDCDWGLGGEGEEHYNLKLYLYNFLLKCKEYKQIIDVELEKNIDGLRADIWFKNNKNQQIVIEVQLSPRTREYIEDKILTYTINNIATMYITDIWKRMIDEGSDRIRLPDWQIYLAETTDNQVLTYTEDNDGFIIKNTKLYGSNTKKTIYYVNETKEVDILNDMDVVKVYGSLLYKKNPHKDFKKVYPNKMGGSYIYSLGNFTFNLDDYNLTNKFTYFDNKKLGLIHVGLIVNDEARMNYTFIKCTTSLFKRKWAEGSKEAPFYFKHKNFKTLSYLVIFDSLSHCLKKLNNMEEKDLDLSEVQFCICFDKASAKQVICSNKNVKIIYGLTGVLKEKDFNIL